MKSLSLDLAEGLRRSGMTHDQLWLRYFGLGGNSTGDQLRRQLDNNFCPDTHEHNIVAQALNDAFVEQDSDHPVAYRRLYRRDAES